MVNWQDHIEKNESNIQESDECRGNRVKRKNIVEKRGTDTIY